MAWLIGGACHAGHGVSPGVGGLAMAQKEEDRVWVGYGDAKFKMPALEAPALNCRCPNSRTRPA